MFLPNVIDRICACTAFTGFTVAQHGTHKPLIQRQLSAVIGNQKHIIHGRVHHLVSDFLCPFRQRIYHFLLLFRWFQNNTMEVGIGNRKLQHIRSLDVCNFLEHGHQFREVIEPGEAGLCSIAGTFGGKLDGSHRFTEVGCPGIEVQQVIFFQCVILQILLHGVHLHHGVGNGSTGGKYYASASGDLVQVAALHIEVTALLRFRLGDTANITHLGVCRKVLVVVSLIHKDTVNTQFLKGHKVILAGLIIQFFQLCLQRFPGFLHLLDGEVLRTISLGLGNAHHNLIDLLLQDGLLPFYRHGDLLKLAVTNDDGIIVAGSNSAAELLAVLRFKVLLGRHKDIGRGIKLQELGCPLLCQMVGDYKQGLLTQPQPLALHGSRYHFKGFACTYHMGKQSVATVKNMSNGVDLMGSQFNFRVHTHKVQVTAIVLTGTDGVELLVVQPAKALSAVGVFPYPVLERLLDQFLLALCDGGFLFVQHRGFLAAGIIDIIEDPHVL